MMSRPQEIPDPLPVDDPVLRAAVAMFDRDGWIDARALAQEAGIGRATLYRRYGDRDRLLGEVIWSIATAEFARVHPRCRGRGAEGIADLVHAILHTSAQLPSMRRFLADHPETALRVMTSRDGVMQHRLISTLTRIVRAEIGEPDDTDAATLAYAVTRVGESFYYRELITGEPADIDAAAVVIRRLLR
ncbi:MULTISPECIES: QsdR family transcriptional regulator [unclassified Streptomyces]|uniref:QsdR family transcriptional regulator n=1 Tax=unclassified Streptomyces TaxID=2593676 RepID=UPI0018F897BB|nr:MULTISPECIES: QsdR family transcriptional regulator [unclassified Streptomyces]